MPCLSCSVATKRNLCLASYARQVPHRHGLRGRPFPLHAEVQSVVRGSRGGGGGEVVRFVSGFQGSFEFPGSFGSLLDTHPPGRSNPLLPFATNAGGTGGRVGGEWGGKCCAPVHRGPNDAPGAAWAPVARSSLFHRRWGGGGGHISAPRAADNARCIETVSCCEVQVWRARSEPPRKATRGAGSTVQQPYSRV